MPGAFSEAHSLRVLITSSSVTSWKDRVGCWGRGWGGVCIGFLVRKPGCCKEGGLVLRVCDPGRVLGIGAGAFEGGNRCFVDTTVPGVESPEVRSGFDP